MTMTTSCAQKQTNTSTLGAKRKGNKFIAYLLNFLTGFCLFAEGGVRVQFFSSVSLHKLNFRLREEH